MPKPDIPPSDSTFASLASSSNPLSLPHGGVQRCNWQSHSAGRSPNIPPRMHWGGGGRGGYGGARGQLALRGQFPRAGGGRWTTGCSGR